MRVEADVQGYNWAEYTLDHFVLNEAAEKAGINERDQKLLFLITRAICFEEERGDSVRPSDRAVHPAFIKSTSTRRMHKEMTFDLTKAIVSLNQRASIIN